MPGSSSALQGSPSRSFRRRLRLQEEELDESDDDASKRFPVEKRSFAPRAWTPSDSEPSDSERETDRRETRAIVTPTRALLERASLARRNRVASGRTDEATATRASPKVLTDSGNAAARRPVAELKFRPDPRLVAAADDAVRAAVADRLNGETRGELVESALRVRRELLKKLTGELRYLEQRARREARAGLGVRGKHTASSAAARRDVSGTRERRVVDARSERRR